MVTFDERSLSPPTCISPPSLLQISPSSMVKSPPVFIPIPPLSVTSTRPYTTTELRILQMPPRYLHRLERVDSWLFVSTTQHSVLLPLLLTTLVSLLAANPPASLI